LIPTAAPSPHFETPLANLRILYSYHTNPLYMAPTQLSAQQVNCGPFYSDSSENGRVVSLATPSGAYDLAAVVARLPAEQRPDLVIIKADASRANMPVNIGALGCPAVLLVGDTQHMQQPIRTMVAYARSQPFAAIVTDHGRRPLHFFAEAGLNHVQWLPGLNLNLHPIKLPAQPTIPLSFVGQAGQFHPVRRHLLEAMTKAGLPLRSGSAPQADAAQVYADSQVNFNCSLNGDVNLRVFEVIAHGGFLLSDRLRPQAGLATLFAEGMDLALYDGPADLIEKCRFYLQNPDECRRIAAQGHQTFLQRHHPLLRRQQLYDLVFGASGSTVYAAETDARVQAFAPCPAVLLEDRMRFYEYAQALNRIATGLPVVVFPGLHPAFVCDIADLSRLAVTMIAPTDWQHAAQTDTVLRAAGISGLLNYRSRDSALEPTRHWGLAVVSQAELRDPAITTALAGARWRFLAVPDLDVSTGERANLDAWAASVGAKPVEDGDYPTWQRA
jgi:hypothetical protein